MPSLTPSLRLALPSDLAGPHGWGLAVTAFLALGLSASACSGQPCERLEHEICAQAGEAVCAQYKASATAAHVPEDAKQKACEILLSDKQTLKMTLEALKRTHHGAAKPGTKPKPKPGAKPKPKAVTSPPPPAGPRQPTPKPAAGSAPAAEPSAPAGPPAH